MYLLCMYVHTYLCTRMSVAIFRVSLIQRVSVGEIVDRIEFYVDVLQL